MSTTPLDPRAPSAHQALPPWAFADCDSSSELGVLTDLAQHGVMRLRAAHGQVARLDLSLPDFLAYDFAHPGLCLLAWAAVASFEGKVQYQLARATGRAINVLHPREGASQDWMITNACRAIRWLTDYDLPPALESDALPVVLDTLEQELAAPRQTYPEVLEALSSVTALIRAAVAVEADRPRDTPITSPAPPTPAPSAFLPSLVVAIPSAATPISPPEDDVDPSRTSPPPTETTANDNSPTLIDQVISTATRMVLPSHPVSAARRQAQHLVIGRHDVLSPPELLHALEVIASECDLVMRATVAALLLFGPAADDLPEWRVAYSPDGVDLERAGAWLILNPLSIRLSNRINMSLPAARPASGLTAVSCFDLPLHPALHGMADLLTLAKARVHAPLVTTAEYQQVRRELRRLRERLDICLTRRSLTEVMAQLLRTRANDEIPLAYLSHTPINTRLKARLHYRSLPVALLQTIWVDSLVKLQRQLGHPFDPLTWLPEGSAGRVGSLFCPDPKSVRSWVAYLHKPIISPLHGKPNLPRVIDWHNDYVRYAVQLLQWALGTRPGARGLLSTWPRNDGHIVVNDKTKGDFRQLPLSPMARAQWQEYVRHCSWLTSRLRLDHPPHWFQLSVRQERLCTKPVDPEALHLGSGSPFTENAHRHALASALSVAGWSGARIAQWMGQASLGDEPGAPYSHHRPLWRAAELENIDTHLTTHGWQVIRGLGHG